MVSTFTYTPTPANSWFDVIIIIFSSIKVIPSLETSYSSYKNSIMYNNPYHNIYLFLFIYLLFLSKYTIK